MSKQRIDDHGEVFAPRWLVEQMLDLATADTPAKMLTSVEDMVEPLAKAIPDKNASPGAGGKPGPSTGPGTSMASGSRVVVGVDTMNVVV